MSEQADRTEKEPGHETRGAEDERKDPSRQIVEDSDAREPGGAGEQRDEGDLDAQLRDLPASPGGL